MLKDISIPYSALQCQDVFCSDNEHITSLDRYVAQLTEACLKSAEATVPFTRPCGESGRIPGWSEFVAPLRTQSIFWHNIWSECGKPHDGVIADIMRRARARYHAAIRQVRRDKTEIVNNRIAAAMSDSRDRDFWNEIKRIRHNKSTVSCSVDGMCNNSDIADMFANKYKNCSLVCHMMLSRWRASAMI